MPENEPPPPAALEGIRVLDLTNRLAEAAGRVFADLGAEVIKIEPPGGCDARFTPPFVDGAAPDDPEGSLFWRAWGLGKKSVVLDLEQPADRERLRELARGADVLLESFAPGTLARLGVGPEELARDNPALLTVSITPWGETPAGAAEPATDLTLAAAGGLLGQQGDKDRPPIPVGFPETSFHGAVQAAADAILALWERERTGLGQHLDVSMQAAVVWSLMYVTGFGAFGQDAPGTGDDRGEVAKNPVQFVPGVKNPVIEPCKDGHVAMTLVLGAQGNAGFKAAMEWLQEEGGLDDDLCGRDWATWIDDIGAGTLSTEQAGRAIDQLLAFLATKTKREIQERAVAHKMLIAPCYTAADLLADPQLAARHYWVEVEGTTHPGPFAKLSATPIRYRGPAPRLGQDQELLAAAPRRPLVPSSPAGAGRPRGRLFEGLKVADLSWIAAGPLITKDLANLGATVVRVESETRVDTLRFIPPFKDPTNVVGSGHTFANMNQSKLGLACNYTLPEAREVVDRLIDWADVVVENYTPGTASRLGFGWEEVRARRPDVVMLSSCMRGQTGPEARHTGFGLHGAALGGFIAITGWPDRPPQPPWGAYTDFISPRYALAALGAALHHRDRTGEGQHIDLAQIEASIHFLEPLVLDQSVNGRSFERPGMASERAAPHGVFAVRDTERYLAIAVESADHWRGLRELVPGLPADPGLEALPARRARREELERIVAAWCGEQDGSDAARRLRAAGVPAEPVLRATDLHAEPRLAERGFFVELEHEAIGKALFDGAVTLFSETPARPTHAGPTIGQHTVQVLRDVLGYGEDEISALAVAGVLT